MAGSGDVRGRSLMGYSDSSYDSDPSMEIIFVDSGSEDSSIQILEPPSPVVIDLVDSSDSEIPDLGEQIQSEGLESPFRSLPTITTVPAITTDVVTTPPTYVTAPVQRSDGEPDILELLSYFQTPTSEVSTYTPEFAAMPTADRYRFEFSVSAPVAEFSTPSFVTPAPVYSVPEPRVQIEQPVVTTSEIPVHAPGIPMISAPVSQTPTGSLGASAPMSLADWADWAMMSSTMHSEYMALAHQYQSVLDQYVDSVYPSWDSFMTFGPPAPFTAPAGYGFLPRDTGADIVHQVAVSVFEGLQFDLQHLPSTSTGLVDATHVAILVDLARSEFLRRVSEIFGR